MLSKLRLATRNTRQGPRSRPVGPTSTNARLASQQTHADGSPISIATVMSPQSRYKDFAQPTRLRYSGTKATTVTA